MIRIYWLLIALSVFACPLLFAQNEFPLDTNLSYIPAPYGQCNPSITFDGTNYFVVWYDQRNIPIPDHSEHIAYWDIYGCRISPQGTLLDSAGIHISYYVYVAGYPTCHPTIAYGNGIFLVTWEDFRAGLGGDIYGARVDTNAFVLDPAGFIISAIPVALQISPSVAFDGTNFLVAWYDQRNPLGRIYGSRVNPEGIVLDPDGILISDSSGVQQTGVSVSFDGTNYLVVWGGTDIHGARVDTMGTVLDTNAIAICISPGDQGYPAVAFNDPYYFVTWQDGDGSAAHIHGARLDTAGTLLDTNGIVISADCGSNPSITSDGKNYLVTWSDYYANIYCTRVDTAGTVLDPGGIVVYQNTSGRSAVAFDSINYFIVCQKEDNIYGARVETSGVVIDTMAILLSTCGYPARISSSFFNGTNYFAVWTDYRDTSSSFIYGTRIDTSGIVLDPNCIPLVEGKNPDISFDGTNFLMTCSNVDIKGARIDTAVTILDTFTVFSCVPNRCEEPAIIFDGERYFVVFEAWTGGANIYGVRVDTSGVILDTNGIIISNAGYYDLYPSVAFDGANYFVVWFYGSYETTFDIYGARIDTNGVLLDTVAIPIALGPYRQWYPSVDFDGANYMVVWQDNRNGYADIYGARVTTDGVVLDPSGIPICTASSGQYKPKIKFDGQNYCVIWADWRNDNYTDIYGCYVNPSGIVIDTFIVSNQPNLQIEPALAKGINKFLITYTGFTDSINVRPANTMRIWGTFKNFTGIEENKNQKPRAKNQLEISPNPFRGAMYLKLQIPNFKSQVDLKIYDVTGRLVKSFNRPIPSEGRGLSSQRDGAHYTLHSTQIIWYGDDDAGRKLPTGVYFVSLATKDSRQVAKVILLR